jgi:hypothetical protein
MSARGAAGDWTLIIKHRDKETDRHTHTRRSATLRLYAALGILHGISTMLRCRERSCAHFLLGMCLPLNKVL